MHMTWLLFACITLFLWIAGNILDKYLISVVFKETEDNRDIRALMLFSTLAVVPIALAVLIGWHSSISSENSAVYGIIAGGCNGVWLWFYFKALARTELSRVTPFFQLTPLFGVVLAFGMLGEILSVSQLFAGGLVLAGGAILSYHRHERRMDWYTALYKIIAAGALSAQMVFFKLLALQSSYANALFWTSVGLILFTTVLSVCIPGFLKDAFQRAFSSRKGVMVNVINECVDNGANLSYVYAAMLGPVALVQSIVAFQPILLLLVSVVSTKIGATFLSEDVSHITLMQKIVGIACASAGGFLLLTMH